MNSIAFIILKASGWIVRDWFVFGKMSKGKGAWSQTFPAFTLASICPKEESQIRFSALISVWLYV